MRAGATSTRSSSRCPHDVRLDGLKIVVDCANGAAYQVAPTAIWELGAEVIAIGVTPNGININDGVGSTRSRRSRRRVVDEQAPISASRSTATPTG